MCGEEDNAGSAALFLCVYLYVYMCTICLSQGLSDIFEVNIVLSHTTWASVALKIAQSTENRKTHSHSLH